MAAARSVVDTSAWIEWLIHGDRGPLGAALAQAMPARALCLVPTVVQLELSKWLHRERGESAADEVIAYTQKCDVVALDTRLALLAADLRRQHRLATADAIVYATALDRKARLLTCDAHFEGLPGVDLLRKPA
jgi:predicted nucleic acid-binding protein